MSEFYTNILFPIITSFFVTYLAIPKIIHFSKLSNLFASASVRSSHKGEVPIFGGIAMFSGLLVSLIIFPEIKEINFILISLIIVFFTGIIDDLLSLSPFRKLTGQILSVLVLIYFTDLRIFSMHNLFGIQDLPYLFSLLFTVFVVIVITNSYNLIDGIDGLAGGLGVIFSLFSGIIFFINNDIQYVIISFALLGSLLAFLKYNYHPARIFMGDTGSLVIGLTLSVLAIRLINQGIEIPNIENSKDKGPLISIALLSIPLYDTFRVFFIRILSGFHPLHPDRNHIHHALLDLGLGHSKSTLILYLFSLLILFFSYFLISMSLGLSIFLLTSLVLSCMAIPFVMLQYKKQKK